MVVVFLMLGTPHVRISLSYSSLRQPVEPFYFGDRIALWTEGKNSALWKRNTRTKECRNGRLSLVDDSLLQMINLRRDARCNRT